ncbi:WD40/YVTN/BNR-like repeat-containing protein [Stenotrophomonas acidaminiphila]|uniref:WD40/YVTN/BNR-like repeat-containing protein n=1 Tax=Stenotrophomonas acidaminiphila TaxID=128780 RepID=UPI003BF03EA8
MADMGTDFNGLPDAGALTGAEVVAVQRGTGQDSTLRTTIAAILAMAGSGAKTGDTLVSARNPGAGWLRLGTVYSQSAYPDLYGLVGLIGDVPPGRNWVAQTPTTGITTAINDACWITERVAVAVGNNVVWRTTDGGVNWVQITVAGNLLAVSRVSSTVVIACGQNGVVLRSVDSGATWTAVSSGTTNSLRTITVFTASRIYLTGDSSTGRLSTDGGASFGAGTGAMADVRRTVRFSGSVAVAFTATGTSAVRTTDGGTTWTTITIPTLNNVRGACVFDELCAVASSSGGVIIRTIDAGVTWTTSTLSGVTNAPAGIVRTSAIAAVLVTSSGTSYCTFDAGASWTAIAATLTNATAAFAVEDSLAVAVGNGAQFRSLPEYSYDSGTQFITPSLAGIGAGLTGYIKA